MFLADYRLALLLIVIINALGNELLQETPVPAHLARALQSHRLRYFAVSLHDFHRSRIEAVNHRLYLMLTAMRLSLHHASTSQAVPLENCMRYCIVTTVDSHVPVRSYV